MAKLSDVTSRFKPDKGFQGADSTGVRGVPRDAPVQFERPEDSGGGGSSSSSSSSGTKRARYD